MSGASSSLVTDQVRAWSIDEMLAPGGLGTVPARLRREDEIEELFGVAAAPRDGTAPGAGAAGGEDAGDTRDELLGWLDRWGMVSGARTGDGLGWEVECPWVGEHTDRAGSGAAYWVGGKFKCHHGHCEGRGWRDLERWVEARVGEESGGLVHVEGWDFGEDVGEAEREAERERSREAWAREAAEGGSVGAGDARDRFFGELIYVVPEDAFFSVRTGQMLARAAVDFAWAADLDPWLPVSNGKTGARMAPTRWFSGLARAGSARARVADAMTYWPGKEVWFEDEIGTRTANRWRPGPGGMGLGVGDADVAPWLRLVGLVCGQDGPGARELLLDWFALVVGAPGVKPGWHVLVQGGQGLGKDLMAQPVQWAVGEGNVGSVNAISLMAGFNGFAEKRLVMIHELRQNTRGASTGADQYAALKELTENTNKRVRINEKYMRPYWAQNVGAYYATSNDAGALALEEDDRRFLVVMAGGRDRTAPWPKAEYVALAGWLAEGGGNELVAEWLEARWAGMDGARRGELLGRAPDTKGKRELLRNVEDPLVAWTRDKIESGDWPDLMTADDVAREYGAAARSGGHGFRYAPGPQKWGVILRALGAEKVYGGDPVRLKSGKKTRLWAVRKCGRFSGMSEPALAQAYVSAAGHAFAEEGDAEKVVSITRTKDLPQHATATPQIEEGGSVAE